MLAILPHLCATLYCKAPIRTAHTDVFMMILQVALTNDQENP